MIARWMRKYWVGELLIAAVFGSILLLAWILVPSPEVVSLFGWDVPMLCGMRRLGGFDCPGCGLTRSFSFMAHGAFGSAWEMNRLGPILFVLFATQPPYRLDTAAADYLQSREESP